MEHDQGGNAAAAAAGPGDDAAFGFLTAVDSPTHGLFGGYLLVDAGGRPLEFHCTAPVRVSRAQQILYGATLQPHLHGRQIGAALLAEGSIVPRLVLTDVASMLHARSHTVLPLALVTKPEVGTQAAAPDGGQAAAAIAIGGVCVTPPAGATEALRDVLAPLAAAVDLAEPFERIRAAIEEAQRH